MVRVVRLTSARFWRLLLAGLWVVLLASACGDDEPEVEEEWEALPFSTTAEHLTVNVDGDYRPLFIRGINLGIAVPGTRAGELAASYDDYRRWFDQMREAGLNVVRIYTLHFPRFYQALADHNRAHPEEPLYVMHGIWLDEENPSGDLWDMSEEFDENIEELVRCVHGDCSIDHRFGRAYGEFLVDISRWVLAWIPGREVHPGEVLHTNDSHPEVKSFEGEHFEVQEAESVEVWFAQRLELLVGFERREYGSERPVSVSSWPSLDPIDHPTEGSVYSSEDVASFDISLIEPVDAPGGIFATYHAYPYYPDYIVDDPDYRQFEDEQGPNSYLGYLTRLRSHYEGIPLFIGEFGVPSSWGSAHWGYENMDHGGHDEVEQGQVGARLMRTIHDINGAGGALFSWIDEWWKPTWITDPFDFRTERRSLWHNLMAAEQNFGLIAFEPEEPDFVTVDGVEADGPIADVEAAADATAFRARLHLEEPIDEDDQVVVGFGTYRDDLGESILPDGVATQNRNEFALVVDGSESAELYVTLAYDLFGIYHDSSDDGQLYRSTATDGEPWRLIRWQNGHERGSNDGEYSFEPTYHDVGELRIRGGDDAASSHDAVVVHDDYLEIRIPWSMLNFVDPSQHEVMHDDRDQSGRQTATSEGVALSVSFNGVNRAETERFSWPGWDEAPQTTERLKPAMDEFSNALDELPTWF